MEEGNEKKQGYHRRKRDEICAKVVKAGKRTYFIDVKPTRREDLYITITESRRKTNRNGRFYYEKHKLHLYPEDMENFLDALREMISFVDENNVDRRDLDTQNYYNSEDTNSSENQVEQMAGDYTDVHFDDLNNS